jgi:hypothetical protein
MVADGAGSRDQRFGPPQRLVAAARPDELFDEIRLDGEVDLVGRECRGGPCQELGSRPGVPARGRPPAGRAQVSNHGSGHGLIAR